MSYSHLFTHHVNTQVAKCCNHRVHDVGQVSGGRAAVSFSPQAFGEYNKASLGAHCFSHLHRARKLTSRQILESASRRLKCNFYGRHQTAVNTHFEHCAVDRFLKQSEKDADRLVLPQQWNARHHAVAVDVGHFDVALFAAFWYQAVRSTAGRCFGGRRLAASTSRRRIARVVFGVDKLEQTWVRADDN